MQILSEEYELITLWVRIVPQRGEAAVSVRLEATVEGQRQTLLDLAPIPAGEFGLPTGGEALAYAQPRVAPSLVTELSAWCAAKNPEGRPLWIALIPPCGHLGVIPWEVDLVPAMDVPVLRLPGFLEPRRETRSALDVAVICSVPHGVSKAPIRAPELDRVLRALLTSSPSRRILIHVFCDASTASSISGDLRTSIQVHEEYTRPPDSRLPGKDSNPWFEWVTAAMDGQALDAVHFIAHGVIGSSGGMLALAVVPGGDEPGGVYANANQISDFLTQHGAWSAGFHVPAERESEIGLRSLADAIGRMWPGSVIYHDAVLDPGALEPATRLVYGSDTSPAPKSPSLFMYVQPRQVESMNGGHAEPEGMRATAGRDVEWDDLPPAYLDLFARENVPVYVAQNERIADQVKVFLGRGDANSDEPTLPPEVSQAVSKAMATLHSFVANYAVESEARSEKGAGQ